MFGEVGLAGEVRPVQRGQERIREAAKLGFKRILLPAANMPKQGEKGEAEVELLPVRRLSEVLERLQIKDFTGLTGFFKINRIKKKRTKSKNFLWYFESL